ncbi:PRC-barrel domain-containing protein [Candidatus Formimonas warabiya]|uniref:PRC-barrel domain-containing protein n=1 Tax=Formimonas warabiya TaxID=1761012 RepID=A0A3G1KNA0_FORW1|nr:PRC-barrel domain-containing protein [Candidatus Formimonas warabiya]ATW23971.1 hypothetical protein DCMF_03460 [Candidatus Formimonas warabiya]
MFKGRQIKGLRVITFGDGKEIGRVEDLLINTETGMLQGFVIENRSILKNAKYVQLGHVVSVGRDAVMITSIEDVQDDHDNSVCKLSWQNRLEKNVFSKEGTDIGTVQDIFFELPEGRILGIEMSGGIWADLNQGRKMVPWHQILSGKGENLLVDTWEEDIWL